MVAIHHRDIFYLFSRILTEGATLFDYSFCCINLVYLVNICMIFSPEHRIDHLSCYDIGFNQDLSLNIVMTDLQDMDSTRI